MYFSASIVPHVSYPFSATQACKNFYDDGVCKQECPPMQIYNPSKYHWEKNKDGKYAYGATCVKDCPEHLLKDNGACVRACPPKKKVIIFLLVKLFNIIFTS
jgi:hypothetical protein